VASNGSCSMVTWTIFKNHLLEVGLTQNRETVTLQNLTSCWFGIFCHVWGPCTDKVSLNSIWLRARPHMTSHNTWGPVTTLHDFGSALGQASRHFFLGSQYFHGHGSWLVCEVALNTHEHHNIARGAISAFFLYLSSLSPHFQTPSNPRP